MERINGSLRVSFFRKSSASVYRVFQTQRHSLTTGKQRNKSKSPMSRFVRTLFFYLYEALPKSSETRLIIYWASHFNLSTYFLFRIVFFVKKSFHKCHGVQGCNKRQPSLWSCVPLSRSSQAHFDFLKETPLFFAVNQKKIVRSDKWSR